MTSPSRWSWIAIAAGCLLIGLGLGTVSGGRSATADAGTVPPAVPVPAPASPDTGPAAGSAAASAPAVPGGPPVRLRIPGQGLDAPVVAVAVIGGALGVPDDPDVIGWWRDGAVPGDGAGSVVLDGHVDTADRGRGALFRLDELRPGDAVQIMLADGTAEYTVAAIRHYTKTALPPDLFDRSGTPRLVLISCGGPFDRSRRSYRDNVVVYGVPTA